MVPGSPERPQPEDRRRSTQLAASLALGVLLGCTRSSAEASAATTATAHASSVPAAVALASNASTPPIAQGPTSPGQTDPISAWRTALSLEDYEQALSLLKALPESERTPGIRYAMARSAVEQQQGDFALQMLAELETTLPDFREEISQLRAQAAAAAGRWDESITWYSGRSKLSERIDGTLVLARAQRWEAARVSAVALLAEVERAGHSARTDHRVKLHALLAQANLALGSPQGAVPHLRWMALESPSAPQAANVLAELAQVQSPLSAAEHLSRANAFARTGDVAACESALTASQQAKGRAPTTAEREWLLGLVRYNGRRELGAAATHFQSCAKASSLAERPKCLFYRARALSRADRDAEAIALYEQILTQHRKSSWAQQAAFLGPRLHLIAGRWRQALSGLERYLKLFPNGEHARATRRLRALALLAAGRPKESATALSLLPANNEEKPRLDGLRGVAAMQSGDRSGAVALWQRLVVDSPLSLPALYARARLTALAEPIQEPLPEAPPQVTPLAVDLPPKVALLYSLGLVREAEAALVQAEAQATAGFSGREGEVLCTLHGKLGVAAERYRLGRQVAATDALEHLPSQDNRWLWDCLYPRPWQEEVTRLELREKLPIGLVYSVMRQESTFKTGAGSPVGATGLLQLMPSTAERVARELELPHSSEELSRPGHNLALGSHYLATVLGYFSERPELGVAAYNAGPSAVSEWLVGGEKLPPELFVALIPFDETRQYVYRVMSNWARYRYLEGGLKALPSLEVALPLGRRAPTGAF
jgi:soluble lytic murein transglycosylase